MIQNVKRARHDIKENINIYNSYSFSRNKKMIFLRLCKLQNYERLKSRLRTRKLYHYLKWKFSRPSIMREGVSYKTILICFSKPIIAISYHLNFILSCSFNLLINELSYMCGYKLFHTTGEPPSFLFSQSFLLLFTFIVSKI